MYPYGPSLKAGPVQAKSCLLTAWDVGTGLLALTVSFSDYSWHLSGYGNLSVAPYNRTSDCLPSPQPLLSSLTVSSFLSPLFSPPLLPGLAVNTNFFLVHAGPFCPPRWLLGSLPQFEVLLVL